MKHLIIPVLVLLVILGACKKNSDSAVPDTHGNFMFVNAVPGNDQFNVMLDSLPVASNIGYGANTGYKSFRAQKYNLIISNTRQPGVALYRGQIFLRNNHYYSAYVGADSAGNQILIATEDDLSAPAAGMSKFRVINFAQAFRPNRTPLGMDVYSDTLPRFFRGLTFPAQTGFAPLYGDSAHYKINFRWSDSLRVLKTFDMATQAGKIYTLVSNGYPLDPARFNVLLIQHN
ncbi:protein of unknown function [Chitinophaga ginsengisegetis]|uniref:DUF4397 domain-containing protein n=1 Tax=Chitinophaga ginsengisegetis TaxID=393003 RepID=A0A1T5P0Z6_9BACT|nr:DUF4397 domain-containing protein [Chitinophaga ginsengisegetis]MDR6566875.1 hypothetical protein [Chitinophaga ginsengisegetis]MDR6646605.1 hypothetical protein [Chitinophaga ginsengisegetis]MDR6652955.1 hypothetical protein [Chitinophaga ginsengisegetis]SKD06317.1 protein of unknown function [Chitinophaga ginsengisegetis]